jgi:hypothetical protein
MGGARADIPREAGYDPGTWVNNVQPGAPYTPWGLGQKSGAPTVSLVGLLVLAAVAYGFAHFERRRK